MKIKKIYLLSIIAVIIVFGYTLLRANTSVPDSSTQLKLSDEKFPIVDSFFKIYRENPYRAFSYKFKSNEYLQIDDSYLKKMNGTLDLILPKLGVYHGHELLIKKVAGNNLFVVSYLLKYDRQPLRLNIVLYRPNNDWRVHEVSFDDTILKELNTAISVYSYPENYKF